MGGVDRLCSQMGWCSMGTQRWGDRINPARTPIKSIRIVRRGKKTENHCKK